jgi:phosphoribosylaminoimidazole-succinocarboxamide synthase
MPKRFSTKNLEIIEAPTLARTGIGIFEYVDDYSVFHYGKMPDRIPGKGEAICRMAVFNFRMLEKAGIRTHFRRFIEPNRIEITLARVQDPNVKPIEPEERGYLVPLQVIFRNELPPGNSLQRRLDSGKASLADIGLDRLPNPGEPLDRPIIEYTTKLEEIDRFISTAEAQRLAALDDEQFRALRDMTLLIDDVLSKRAREVGLTHSDGKVEYIISDNGHVTLADNVGTPDENRFMFGGVHCGKQVMRDWYLARGMEAKIQEWAAQGIPRSNWPAPEKLPHGFVTTISDMYRAICERWTGELIWDVPELPDVLRTVRLLNSQAVTW